MFGARVSKWQRLQGGRWRIKDIWHGGHGWNYYLDKIEKEKDVWACCCNHFHGIKGDWDWHLKTNDIVRNIWKHDSLTTLVYIRFFFFWFFFYHFCSSRMQWGKRDELNFSLACYISLLFYFGNFFFFPHLYELKYDSLTWLLKKKYISIYIYLSCSSSPLL